MGRDPIRIISILGSGLRRGGKAALTVGSPKLPALYAMLAAIGAILPFIFLLPWLHRHGLDLPRFLAGPFANGPASIFSIDVLWAATVFLVFAVVEGRRAGVRPLWLAPLIVFLIGLCCALPLFLYLRERALTRSEL